MQLIRISSAIAILGLLLTGCATHGAPGTTVSRSQAGVAQTIHEGEVMMVREVQIEGGSAVGTVAGGYLGYKMGKRLSRSWGSSSGSRAAKTGSAVAGAVAGSAVQQAATQQKGLEVTVELDKGQVVSVVQPADQKFEVGDQVRVLLRPDGSARVLQ